MQCHIRTKEELAEYLHMCSPATCHGKPHITLHFSRCSVMQCQDRRLESAVPTLLTLTLENVAVTAEGQQSFQTVMCTHACHKICPVVACSLLCGAKFMVLRDVPCDSGCITNLKVSSNASFCMDDLPLRTAMLSTVAAKGMLNSSSSLAPPYLLSSKSPGGVLQIGIVQLLQGNVRLCNSICCKNAGMALQCGDGKQYAKSMLTIDACMLWNCFCLMQSQGKLVLLT